MRSIERYQGSERANTGLNSTGFETGVGKLAGKGCPGGRLSLGVEIGPCRDDGTGLNRQTGVLFHYVCGY